MNKLAMVVMSLVPGVALAQTAPGTAKGAAPVPPKVPAVAPPAMPAAPPEVKATVNVFKGNWSFDATMSATGMPGMDKPANMKMTFNCKEAAGKTAVSCDSKAKSPMGPMDALFVIAYDPYSKAVHFIGVTNSNEVHDHVCKWS